MSYIAFDLGASGGKLFRGTFDGSRLAIEIIHKFENEAIPIGNGLYWDFINIWHQLCIGIQKANSEETITSFGIDSFCNDFSFINNAGDLLSPIRSYRDTRTIRCSEAIYKKMSPWRLYQNTGNQIASFNALMQLASMREEGKGSILDEAYRMLFLPDLIAYYMTGEELMERTLCSVSQMYRFDIDNWSDEILQAFNIPKHLFGTITEPGSISGKVAPQFQKHWGVNEFDFVSVCEHDTASAFLSLPGNDDKAILSSGTWSLIGCENNYPIINEYGFKYNIANEGSLKGYHRILRNVMGSWLLQELRADYRQSGEEYSFSYMENMAGSCKPFAFLIDVDDALFFSPGNMRMKIREKCQSLTGDKPESLGQYVRCICESLALKYRWTIEKLEELTKRKFPVINIIGGGSKDALTCQMTANACGRPVIAGPADASAIGNILVQLMAHDEIRDIKQGREVVLNSFPFIEYLPDDIRQWEDVYQQYVKAYNL